MPAALALDGGGRRNADGQRLTRYQRHRRGDEDELQALAQRGQQCVGLGRRRDHHRGLQRRAQATGAAHILDGLVHRLAQRADGLPLGQQRGVGRDHGPVGLGKDRAPAGREHGPGLLGGEAEEGRHPAQHGLGDVPQRGLRAAPGHALGRRGVEAVLQHVQVEGAQVLAAIHLQLGHHRVELIDLEVGQDLALQRAGAGQGVVVDLQQLLGRDRIGGRVEVADIGQ